MRLILKALEMAALHLQMEDEVLDRAHDDIVANWEWNVQDVDKELRLDEINIRSGQINEALKAVEKVIQSCEEESVRRRG